MRLPSKEFGDIASGGAGGAGGAGGTGDDDGLGISKDEQQGREDH